MFIIYIQKIYERPTILQRTDQRRPPDASIMAHSVQVELQSFAKSFRISYVTNKQTKIHTCVHFYI